MIVDRGPLCGKEIVTVPYGLNEDERQIQNQRGKRGKDELRGVVQRPEFLGGKVRKHHREAGQRDQYRQRGAAPCA